VLFEVVLAVALFAGTGAFALASIKTVFAALDRSRREQELVDLARSRMAELEAGLVNLNDLRGEADAVTASGSESANDRINDLTRGERSRWSLDVQTSRTEFTGLTLVEITANETNPAVPEAQRLSYTLRQLMALRVGGEE
jgi:type II secretory pathway component PulJ